MKRVLFISFLFCLLFLLPLTGETVKYAWWLLIEYEPETKHIQAIPVSEIDPSWTLAEALSKEAIPPEELSNFQKHYERDGYSFTKEGDFNGDGKRDKAIVGIYKDKSGKMGRFLLILTESQKNKWTKSFVYKNPGKPGFSILRIENNQLCWCFCMDCDIMNYVRWKNGKYVLEPFEFGDKKP
jgi:hypothetical protein